MENTKAHTMFTYITPHLQLKSVLEMQTTYLKQQGIEGILLDIDCTLKDYHDKTFRPEILAWVQSLRDEGFRLCLLSNGRPARVAGLAALLQIDFVGGAFKPFPFRCQQAVRKLGLPARRVALVGDQVFADVLAGRLAGVHTVLVTPTSPLEPWFTRLKRPLERRFLRWLNRRSPVTLTSADTNLT